VIGLTIGGGVARAAPPLFDGLTLDQGVCRLIERAALANRLPVAFLTRLVWRESSFRAAVTSPAGALGIAQFMPQTAAERGLTDPLDPRQAIAQAARLLSELARRFGNLGLAAASYNAGPARVAKWLDGAADLPAETRAYVLAVTLLPVEDWRVGAGPDRQLAPGDPGRGRSCLETAAELRRQAPAPLEIAEPDGRSRRPGVPSFESRLTRYFDAALAHMDARERAAELAAEEEPLPAAGGRATQAYADEYENGSVPAPSTLAAAALCARVRAMGARCMVYRR
jgi:hypothetical protein